MTHFFNAGGPFMWPILFCSAMAVLFAVMYARTSRNQHVVVAAGAIACAVTLSLLSLATGFQFAVSYLAQSSTGISSPVYLLGVSEALNGLVLSLLASLATMVLVSVGAYRRVRRGERSEISVRHPEPVTSA